MPEIGVDWVEEIKRLREPGQSDASLAASLGVSKQLLSAVLNGTRELSPRLKAKVWSRVRSRRPMNADVALAFLTKEKAAQLLEDHRKRVQQNEVGKSKPAVVDDAVRDLVKLKKARRWTDAMLAADLGVDPPFLSSMLSGDKPVSFNVKRMVWARLKYDLSRNTVLWFLPKGKAQAIIEADIQRGRRNAQRAVEAQARRAERKAGTKK